MQNNPNFPICSSGNKNVISHLQWKTGTNVSLTYTNAQDQSRSKKLQSNFSQGGIIPQLKFMLFSLTPPHTCFRGCNSAGSFSHIFWDCDRVTQIWKQLEKFASKISNNNINLTIYNCLLFSPIIGLSIHNMRLIHTICVAVHWLIAHHWKSPTIPLSHLKTRINNINLMEKIFHTIQNTNQFYTKKWDPWFNHANLFFNPE